MYSLNNKHLHVVYVRHLPISVLAILSPIGAFKISIG